ncbi:MAG: hypothetical protein IH626_16260 [Rhodospirillales bacterium]|nr:hypothetical protein [Rhodospirillales bacterium]
MTEPEPIRRLIEAGYKVSFLRRVQKRFADRALVEPSIDLSRFRVSVGFDTIKLRCIFPDRTPRRHLQVRLKREIGAIDPYVDADPHAPQCEKVQTCIVTLQRPTIVMLQQLRHIVVSEPELVEVHVAADFRPRGDLDRTEWVRQCVTIRNVLYRHAVIKPSVENWTNNPRWASAPDRPATCARSRFSVHDESRDFTIGPQDTLYLGHRCGPIEARIYVKVSDRISSPHQVTLPTKKIACRYEVVLGRVALDKMGIVSVGDLQSFPFHLLGPQFNFRLLTLRKASGSALNQKVTKRVHAGLADRLLVGGLSLCIDDHLLNQHWLPDRTIAYHVLNKRMNRALTHLTLRVRRGEGAASV